MTPMIEAAEREELAKLLHIARKLETYAGIYTGDKEAREMASWCRQEVLRQSAAARATVVGGEKGWPKLPLSYRPHELDDWGTVRDADGRHVLRAKALVLESEKGAHRLAGTDPDESWGRFVVAAVNQAALSVQGHQTKCEICGQLGHDKSDHAYFAQGFGGVQAVGVTEKLEALVTDVENALGSAMGSQHNSQEWYEKYRPDTPTHMQEIETAFANLRAGISRGVAEGWKLVPLEPTKEMIQAGAMADMTRNQYKAMLAAAPEPDRR